MPEFLKLIAPSEAMSLLMNSLPAEEPGGGPVNTHLVALFRLVDGQPGPCQVPLLLCPVRLVAVPGNKAPSVHLNALWGLAKIEHMFYNQSALKAFHLYLRRY